MTDPDEVRLEVGDRPLNLTQALKLNPFPCESSLDHRASDNSYDKEMDDKSDVDCFDGISSDSPDTAESHEPTPKSSQRETSNFNSGAISSEKLTDRLTQLEIEKLAESEIGKTSNPSKRLLGKKPLSITSKPTSSDAPSSLSKLPELAPAQPVSSQKTSQPQSSSQSRSQSQSSSTAQSLQSQSRSYIHTVQSTSLPAERLKPPGLKLSADKSRSQTQPQLSTKPKTPLQSSADKFRSQTQPQLSTKPKTPLQSSRQSPQQSPQQSPKQSRTITKKTITDATITTSKRKTTK